MYVYVLVSLGFPFSITTAPPRVCVCLISLCLIVECYVGGVSRLPPCLFSVIHSFNCVASAGVCF